MSSMDPADAFDVLPAHLSNGDSSPVSTTIVTRFAATLVMLAVISTGCSDSDPSPPSTADAAANPPVASSEPPNTSPPARSTEKSTAQTKTALIKVLKTEPDFAGLPAGPGAFLANCMADVIIKYGKPASIEEYIDGSIKLDDIKGSDSAEAEEAGFACAENAAKVK